MQLQVKQTVQFIPDSVYRRDWQHACAVSNMALDIISCCSDLEIGNGGGSKLQLKIGIHTGKSSVRLDRAD